jgi:hypothetical protein
MVAEHGVGQGAGDVKVSIRAVSNAPGNVEAASAGRYESTDEFPGKTVESLHIVGIMTANEECEFGAGDWGTCADKGRDDKRGQRVPNRAVATHEMFSGACLCVT